MASYRLNIGTNHLALTTRREGRRFFSKEWKSLPAPSYIEVKTAEFEFHFNLKGEIKFIRGLNTNWPHPMEVLKRTDGNDWVYYTGGAVIGDVRLIDCLGAYYLPCLPYPSNPIWEFNPYSAPNIVKAFAAWSQLFADLYQIREKNPPKEVTPLLDRIITSDERALFERPKRLYKIIGERPSVLPPDTRHVDYEVIPLMVSDGCLYRCEFCQVKSDRQFTRRTIGNIEHQLHRLNDYYSPDINNYHALFLGNHDALRAGGDLIFEAVSQACRTFNFQTPLVFLFGSVASLLEADNGLFETLSKITAHTYINVGLESVDGATLATLRKPVDVQHVREAFQKALAINRAFANIEITSNFLLGDHLSRAHLVALMDLISNAPSPENGKGTVYLSPLIGSKNKSVLLNSFYEIKAQSRLPVLLYLIQRL